MQPAIDPFESLEHQYNFSNLLWASSNKGSLKVKPPLELTQDRNGIIRIGKVRPEFQERTGIQVGHRLLQLQGKKVTDYQDGFEEIQRNLNQSLAVELVVLNDPGGVDGWVKVRPKANKPKKSVIPGKDKESRNKDPIVELQKRYRNEELLWASNIRGSAKAPVPFELVQDDDNVVRIGQIEPKFQELTGVRVGQRLVQLQKRDIEMYQGLDEIQAIVQDTLQIDFVVIKSEDESNSSISTTTKSHPKKHKKKKKKRSKLSKASLTNENQSLQKKLDQIQILSTRAQEFRGCVKESY